MLGDRRMPPEDDSRPVHRRPRGCGVRRIDDVLAGLLDQYRVRFPDLNEVVVEQRSATK